MRDFNQVVEAKDKFRVLPVNAAHISSLKTIVDSCHLLDLGFQGPKYTWTNYRKGLALIRERLDRAWCNLLWHHKFDQEVVWHLPWTHSDYHPILFEDIQGQQCMGFQGFRFLEA